jgi:hypothetical protein
MMRPLHTHAQPCAVVQNVNDLVITDESNTLVVETIGQHKYATERLKGIGGAALAVC